MVHTRNNSSQLLCQQQKSWHWAVPGGEVTRGADQSIWNNYCTQQQVIVNDKYLLGWRCLSHRSGESFPTSWFRSHCHFYSICKCHISRNGSFHMLDLYNLHLQNLRQTVAQRLWPKAALFPLYLSFSHRPLGPSWAGAGEGSYPMAHLQNAFHLAWLNKDHLPSSCTHSWFVQLSFLTPKRRRDALNVAEYCTAQYYWELHWVLLSLLFSKAHRV